MGKLYDITGCKFRRCLAYSLGVVRCAKNTVNTVKKIAYTAMLAAFFQRVSKLTGGNLVGVHLGGVFGGFVRAMLGGYWAVWGFAWVIFGHLQPMLGLLRAFMQPCWAI